MSNTRIAPEGGAFRPDRFASSDAITTGLPANLVARRCSVLQQPADRELVYWLQYQSHQEGGLSRVAARLQECFPGDIATPTMRAAGNRPGQIYDKATCRKVRDELRGGELDLFLLRGEISEIKGIFSREGAEADLEREASKRPVSYPAAAFADYCRSACAGLADHLREACLNPELPIANGSPWYFPTLETRLRELMQAEAAAVRERGAPTSIGNLVDETLSYALDQRCMVVIEGKGRIGKSFACKRWCDTRPGKARFVSVPSCTDGIAFYRAIAKALGVSNALSLKGSQIRDRVEATLLTGDLMLVFDEGWALFPQRGRPREAMPVRLSWIMTVLQNNNVPVAICSTPQFMRSQRAYTAATQWSSEQFIGRIAHFEKLPESVPQADLEAVARKLLPEADARCIAGLVSYATVTDKGLAAIEFTEKRARYLAGKAGRCSPTTEDVVQAIQQSGLPSESALAQALGLRKAQPSPTPLAPDCTASARAIQTVRTASSKPHRKAMTTAPALVHN